MNTYNIEIREFNGTDYDVLYPKTTIGNVDGLNNKLRSRPILNSILITIPANGWIKQTDNVYIYEVSNSNISSSDYLFLDFAPSDSYSTDVSRFPQFKYISYIMPLTGKIRFTCLQQKPTIGLIVNVSYFKLES